MEKDEHEEIIIMCLPNRCFRLFVDNEWRDICSNDRGWRFLQRFYPTVKSIHGMQGAA